MVASCGIFPVSDAGAVHKIIRERDSMLREGLSEDEVYKALVKKYRPNGGKSYIAKFWTGPKLFESKEALGEPSQGKNNIAKLGGGSKGITSNLNNLESDLQSGLSLLEKGKKNPENKQYQGRAQKVDFTITDKDIVFLKKVLDQFVKLSQGMNVHDFNKKIVAPYKTEVLAIGERLFPLSSRLTFITLRKQIEEFSKTLSGNDLQKTLPRNLEKLAVHLKKSGIDPETGLNVVEMLQRGWALTDLRQNPFDSKLLFLSGLVENIDGGCFGGFGGRFLRDYLVQLFGITSIYWQ